MANVSINIEAIKKSRENEEQLSEELKEKKRLEVKSAAIAKAYEKKSPIDNSKNTQR
jgi:hypothetical protein